MKMVCLDVEGVLLPEIWQELARATGLVALARTTRDEPDYGKLMAGRIAALNKSGVGHADIMAIAANVEPLPGARAFLNRIRQSYQVALVSDSFAEFLMPLAPKLGWPSLYCHNLLCGDAGEVAGWRPRLPDQKPKCVRAFQSLGFRVFAAGDSFNDLGMLRSADGAAFIHAPDSIAALIPELPRCADHDALEAEIGQFFTRTAQAT
ncbi:MAG: bifunctional phosphoserine phosphatase/homoserine phosphotransferase ThrH [Paracoccus sp. (in: a-proteobacteria)]|uniref:bifunctional phosphoserine phosphatase/homoserine phosphotransferase ThrH n=1 Tax=Paracoccus sp. TaxID=267 RepID=UPI0026DF74A4|nr:bifunctional phosphoserine phosphatase/homoserine phosphotransferase ThrH [Paracoccus sp. (in: a-proteobacteria)]MDO5622904.1 bifunctional phosphoserine phosphatase/homoserine phosphotransferase ThrH [Paracoccus sp. (in: a-proteobacteria)]